MKMVMACMQPVVGGTVRILPPAAHCVLLSSPTPFFLCLFLSGLLLFLLISPNASFPSLPSLTIEKNCSQNTHIFTCLYIKLGLKKFTFIPQDFRSIRMDL
mmetsp:Transcript_11111/g.41502  ORF Transcript_11111/g.41502 Transcript_11111/m.41502 type:complete len:101 (+) Transcript_11111:5842-6144(+)